MFECGKSRELVCKNTKESRLSLFTFQLTLVNTTVTRAQYFYCFKKIHHKLSLLTHLYPRLTSEADLVILLTFPSLLNSVKPRPSDFENGLAWISYIKITCLPDQQFLLRLWSFAY